MKRCYFFIGLLVSCSLFSCSKGGDDPTPDQPAVTYKLRLTGNVKACDNSNVTNGDLIIAGKNMIAAMHISNGTYDTTFYSDRSFDSVFVWAVDLNTLKTSDTLAKKISGEAMDLGTISACKSDVTEYVRCTINSETYTFVPQLFDSLMIASWDTLSAPTTYFYRADLSFLKNRFGRMQFNGMSAGTFGMNWNCSFGIARYYAFNMPASGTITYTTYGNVGQYITGTMNVPFNNNNDGLNYVLTGSFKVLRDR